DESVTIHMDCLDLCRREFGICKRDLKDGLSKGGFNRIWLAAAWRYAWREMQPLEMPSYSALADLPPHLISKICGFQKSFPPEITTMIQSYFPSSFFWRSCSTLQLIEEMDSAELHEVVTCSLSNVLCWSRGSVPKFVESGQTADPYVRLIMDSRGIKSIERISEDSANNAFRIFKYSDVFLIEHAETIKTIMVEFLLGMSRLHIPAPPEISIWSVPMPIENFLGLQSIQREVQLPISPSSRRFVAINLDPRHCTGLSFFTNMREIVYIHGHRKNGLPALETYRNLNAFYEGNLIWTYIPLTAEDKINAISVKRYIKIESACTITLMMKSGQPIIGTLPSNNQSFQPDEALYTMEKQHPLLIHNIISGNPISYIGLNTKPEIISHDSITTEKTPLACACFSSASLENVLTVFVFTDDSTKLCKGIMIEYSNGLKRALGQCRLGLDSVQKYNRPLKFSYATTKYSWKRHKSVYVSFDLENDLHLRDKKLSWKHYEMRGQLSFWFRANDIVLRVSQD
ncbi:hypothetical protein M431DRAFT_71299, partial [Trichoderma harzianum CBS 226.95]